MSTDKTLWNILMTGDMKSNLKMGITMDNFSEQIPLISFEL